MSFSKKKAKKNVKKGQHIWKSGQKCTRFENILRKDRQLCATIALSKLLEKALLPSGLFSVQQMLIAPMSDKISVYSMLNGEPIV